MEFVRIFVLAFLAAMFYGIVHDQVTVRICWEYFTIGHPPLLPERSATVLALGWGILSTWWLGLPFGYLLASASRNGRRQPLSWRQLQIPIARLLLIAAATATLFGALAYLLAEMGWLELSRPLSALVAGDLHSRYLAARWAHGGSYLAGIVGSCVLIWHTWQRRQPIGRNLRLRRKSETRRLAESRDTSF